ncbi:TPA: penicillin-binding protein 2 [Campylobacter fetus subsp. venerealis]|uniref:Penicillin-binding protein 2 n=1 Tax=Campylobacter fetus subsp. venerealis NCTC 10354 TaxID=983328 RepID=A0AAE6IZ46_CAMFE|nr:penicillin-binding protein 2 [Campylobacter fetus]OCS22813.1 penicillin-binding protein 2 [Campylobacter fetus subsp. venerealis cfvi97/532]OCS26168.1 penicillin-binding protein 2 [Campylobacter fetus subsp. venerealis cfvB10]OCS29734.1 penicillin-binding protein 2 [Campylobacter fetus subsp. venerealis LMG 6570 = CCUG 33900]OCS42847.1 penicillin-binding protein 2 [Campylobacter fetus subsp. venerealis cfvi02/298]AHE94483.1 penicillin-binding protein 2 [Campylobacter fetus subsp. venerealis
MRMRIVYAILILVWTILLVRIYYLSIKSNEYYEEIAEKNAIKTELIAPVRGQVFDIKGKPLAVNRLGFSVLVKPHLRKNEKVLDEELKILTHTFTDLNVTKLKKEYLKNDSPYNQDFVEVIEFVDYDSMIPHFAKLSLRENIMIKPASKRHYPFNNLASHVIGYVGRAKQKDVETDELTKLTNYTGRSGVERYYNQILQGSRGERKTKVTALNQEVEEVSYSPATSKDITLTLESELQQYVTEAFNKDSGAVVVMSLKDGAILAAGSFPEYDLNPFVTGITQKEWDAIINNLDHPFTNKLVNSLYPPGSVVKMAMGMAFFDSGKIDPTTKIMCDPYFELGGRKFRNWKNYGYVNMTIVEALKESCDTYFYRGSYKVGIDIIAPVLEKYGFGVRSGIDLPNEYIGIVPNKDWKRTKSKEPWYQGDTLNTSIGQGSFLATPVQVARDTAIFASGVDMTPHFLHSIDGEIVEWKTKDILTPQEKSYLKYIRRGMYEVANVQGGTGFRALSASKIFLGAKTGTAQVVGISQSEKTRMKESEMKRYERSHAWITTYGPYEDPQFVVTVLVEHGSSGGSAGGPIVAKIYNKLLDMGYIDQKYIKKEIK